ncbi:MAG: NlpC/P60 family protein [Chlorobium sp.]|nr:MAG: NlpC/P60 family protein [Chlorobium sp.]
MPAWITPYRNILLLCTIAAILFSITGCQSTLTSSGYKQDCKYSLKKRKSYISCSQEGSWATVTCPLPLKVPQRSLDRLFSSIDDYLGTAYRAGGATPEGFDCSGFVYYLYRKNFRMLLPHTTEELATLGTVVPRKQLQRGDLVFFSIGGSRIDHVGIFIGNNSFAHAANSGVVVNRLYERYYDTRYACAARLVTPD